MWRRPNEKCPRVPPGQRVTRKFPVLHAGDVPKIDIDAWRFQVTGLVNTHLELTYDEFTGLPQTRINTDIHCVTGWSRLDNVWQGIRFKDLFTELGLETETQFVMVRAQNNFSTNLLLDDLMRDDVLFAHSHNGKALTSDHGAPLRLIVPHLYFWKSAKWVSGIEFQQHGQPGFWEKLGYHMRGDPWKEERYQ